MTIYTIKFRELVRDKLKLSGKDTEGKAMNERLLVPLGQYQKPSGFSGGMQDVGDSRSVMLTN